MKTSNAVFDRLTTLLGAALLALGLAGCGSGGSSGGSDGDEMGSLTLRLTDAPFNQAARVTVTFAAVHLKPADGGDWIRHVLPATQSIDLLTLQGMATADLVVDLAVPAGDYDEIRLLVDDSVPANNEIQMSSGSTHSLTIPSGSSSGLKIKGRFTVSAARPVTLVADIDLLQSVVMVTGPGDYHLRPVIRLIDNRSAGHLRGMVDVAKLDGTTTSCSDGDPSTHNAVYVYAGHDAVVEDIDLTNKDGDAPSTTTTIKLDPGSGNYYYEVAFLPAGDYTLAFTCKAEVEDLNDDDDDLSFFDIRNVTVLVSNVLFL